MAFSGSTSLSSVSLPESITHVGEYAFADTSIASISIPSSLSDISTYAFAGMKLLTEILLPDDLSFEVETIESVGAEEGVDVFAVDDG